MSGRIRAEQDGAVLRLTIDSPDRMNALGGDMTRDLADRLTRAGEDDRTRVVVLTGATAGRAFCSGADLSDAPDLAEHPERTMDGAAGLVRAVVTCPLPVVARVNGPAVGIGMSLALAADLAYAAVPAYFLQAFTAVGLMPDGGSSLLLAANVGRARAAEMTLLAERLGAAEAAAAGLVAGAFETEEAMDARVAVVVDRCAAASRRSLELTKAALRESLLAGLDAAMEREKRGQVELLATPGFARRAAAVGRGRAR